MISASANQSTFQPLRNLALRILNVLLQEVQTFVRETRATGSFPLTLAGSHLPETHLKIHFSKYSKTNVQISETSVLAR